MILLKFINRRSPLPRSVDVPHVDGYPILSDPYMFKMKIDTPGRNYSILQPQRSYLSFAPPEVIRQQYFSDTTKSKVLSEDWVYVYIQTVMHRYKIILMRIVRFKALS